MLDRKDTKEGIVIFDADPNDAALAHDLESSLNHRRAGAPEIGFFLPGTSREDYAQFQATAIFRVIRHRGKVLAYVIALPREHPRLVALRDKLDGFYLNNPSVLDEPNLCWIAKVAVHPEFARLGMGTILYEDLFTARPRDHFLTASLISPVMNTASAAFHTRLGFIPIGEFHGGDSGDLKNCVSAVYLREPLEEE